VSGTGTLVYRTAGFSDTLSQVTLAWMAPSGKTDPLPAPPGPYLGPRVSPDGNRVGLIVSEGSGSGNVAIYDIRRDAMMRLASGVNLAVLWAPDGQHVVFSAPAPGIFVARADGASQPQSLVPERAALSRSFSPDGKRLAYSQRGQLWTVSIEREAGQWKAGLPERLIESSLSGPTLGVSGAAFSPDGRWLAYQSNESGANEVYVRPSAIDKSGSGGQWQISTSGGTAPRWSPSGDLIYQAGTQLLAVRYTTNGDTFVADRPRVWMAKFDGTAWDLAPDGSHILALLPTSEGRTAATRDQRFVFLQHFFDELRRRAPLPE
jgi:serine/threonine-protein kinase